MPLAAAPTVACPVRAVPVAVVLLASPRPPAPLGTGDVARAGGTAWCPGAAGRGGCSCLSPRPRRRRRERRVSIAPRFQLPPCLYGRGIPTGGCCEGTECAGLQGRSGLGGDGDCRAANAVALARAAPEPSPRRGVEGGRCWGSQHPAAVLGSRVRVSECERRQWNTDIRVLLGQGLGSFKASQGCSPASCLWLVLEPFSCEHRPWPTGRVASLQRALGPPSYFPVCM